MRKTIDKDYFIITKEQQQNEKWEFTSNCASSERLSVTELKNLLKEEGWV